MTTIMKYLKGSVGPIVAVVVLLVFQAFGDLSLPSYTSDIVNIGIQQNGIEEVTPDKIRQSEMDKIQLFMSKEQADKVNQAYTLDSKKKVLELKDNADIESLNKIFARPMVMVLMFSQDSKEMDKMKQGLVAQMKDSLPAGTDPSKVELFDLLVPMGRDTVQNMFKDMIEKVDGMQQSLAEQTAITYVIDEYKAVDINVSSLQTYYIIITGLKMIGVSLLVMVTSILVTFIASIVAAKVARDLRFNIFNKVVSFSNTEMDQFSTASLITRSTNDIQQVQMFLVMMLRMVAYAPILGIGGIIKVLSTKTHMAWIVVLAVCVVMGLVLILMVVAMPKFKKMQKLVDRLNLVSREILTGLPVIRAFSTQKHEEERFDGANKDLTKNMLFTNRVMAFMFPMMMFIMNGVTALIIWVGAHGINKGNLQVGDMMAFMQYTMQIVMSFLMLTMVSIILPRAAVSAKRIDEVLTVKNVILDPEQPKEYGKDGKEGVVEFDHVSFRYPNADSDVLEDITFTAEPGQTTAFIGSTGSGKTTLVNLIPRFYDVTEGHVRIGGVDVRELSQHELRNQLGFVPQKATLFSGTIGSNIGYGCDDAEEAVLEKAADIAQATEFIDGKKERYESHIAQGGSNVSGGQKQRLSIARAIAKRPQVFVFDDSFSALDYKTDVAVRKALSHETADSTVIIVAQRISTIMHADKIIVLDEGKIAGMGTHKELLASNEVYRQIAYSQLSEKELEGSAI